MGDDFNVAAIGSGILPAARASAETEDERCHSGSGSSSDEHTAAAGEEARGGRAGFDGEAGQSQSGRGHRGPRASSSSHRQGGTAATSHGILKALVTLSPFVPRMLKDSVAADAAGKYAAFDTANMRDLVGASQTLAPSMEGVQLAMMIADVKGFTALTEILSKKGGPGRDD